jgi:hypothetical protein
MNIGNQKELRRGVQSVKNNAMLGYRLVRIQAFPRYAR